MLPTLGSQSMTPMDPAMDQPADDRPIGEPMPVNSEPGQGEVDINPELEQVCPHCGCHLCCPKCGAGDEQVTPGQIAMMMPDEAGGLSDAHSMNPHPERNDDGW